MALIFWQRAETSDTDTAHESAQEVSEQHPLPATLHWTHTDGTSYEEVGPAHRLPVSIEGPISTDFPAVYSVVGAFAAVAAGDYADNDVISNVVTDTEGDPVTFADAVRVAGGINKIIGATLEMSEDGVAATSELFLFNAVPTATEMDDNAAFGGVGAADQDKFLTSFLFPALADAGDFSHVRATAVAPPTPLFITAAANSRTIYGVLVFRDATTAETAGMKVTIKLYIE